MRNGSFKVYQDSESVPTTLYFQHPVKSVFYPIHRRSLRRRDVDYSSSALVCFVTFNTRPGCDVTFSGPYGAAAWQALRDALIQTGCRVHAACLMPDHVHLLVSPSGRGETVSDIVARAKSWVAHVLKRDYATTLCWQPSFYDHCLRNRENTEEAFETIRHYIHQNPGNANLPTPHPYLL